MRTVRRALASALAGTAALAPTGTAPPQAPPRPLHSASATQPAQRSPQALRTPQERAYRATHQGPYADQIAASASRWNLEPHLVHALLWSESRLNPGAENDRTGARGIAQFVRAGAAAVARLQRRRGVREVFGYGKALDPLEAIPAACELLAHGIEVCGSLVEAVGAYNSGRCVASRWARSVLRLANELRAVSGLGPLQQPRSS